MSVVGLTFSIIYIVLTMACVGYSFVTSDHKGRYVLRQVPIELGLLALMAVGLTPLAVRLSWFTAYALILPSTVAVLYCLGWLLEKSPPLLWGVYGLSALILLARSRWRPKAMGRDMVMHSFSFSGIWDSPDVEVLDYQFGSSGNASTLPYKSLVQHGKTFGQWITCGVMPRFEFLYVKWRLKASGQVYEDKVDLTTRLPADITNCGIHFVIKGAQLYVYLIPPPGVWPARAMKPSAPAYLKQHQVYPDQAK